MVGATSLMTAAQVLLTRMIPIANPWRFFASQRAQQAMPTMNATVFAVTTGHCLNCTDAITCPLVPGVQARN